ncbi:phage terminase large subunit family protein [Laspinema olomoucense]|uniref:Phage terminase large subunit family protein n=1 Tax=Laspinema olomoucense D3b TaxID=2953688 RepID=A0ABT2NAT9_9CYAN|nr:phage terminase large subunit family protein [Laspinema sp. D3b]MCT7979823.1 phage terminase large subunit family protein [Laspinema sp. D3b]
MLANSQSTNRSPGMPCPECGFFIEMSIESLLYKQGFTCPGCLLELTMERTSSQPALELLQKVQTSMEKVQKTKRFDL